MSQKQIEDLITKWDIMNLPCKLGNYESIKNAKSLASFLSDNGCVVAKEIIKDVKITTPDGTFKDIKMENIASTITIAIIEEDEDAKGKDR